MDHVTQGNAGAVKVWSQLGFALNQNNARGRASAVKKARRMVAEFYGEEYDSNRSLESYHEELDKLVGMQSFSKDWYE